LPLVALMALVVVGGIGLAVDAGAAYGHERDDHNLADAAALAATTYLSKNTTQIGAQRQTGATNAATTVLARNGAAGVAANLTLVPVDINGNPTSGNSWANGTAWGVKATIASTHNTFLIRAVGLGSTGATETATAVYGYPSTIGGVVPFAINLDASQHPIGYTLCLSVASGGGSGCPSPGSLKDVSSVDTSNNSGTVFPEECELSESSSEGESDPPDNPMTGTTFDTCFQGSVANGLRDPVTLGATQTAGSISSFTSGQQQAINNRINSANDAWDKFNGNSPRVVTVIVLNGDIGNPTVSPYAFQQVYLQAVSSNTFTVTLIQYPVPTVPGQPLSTTPPGGLSTGSLAVKLIN